MADTDVALKLLFALQQTSSVLQMYMDKEVGPHLPQKPLDDAIKQIANRLGDCFIAIEKLQHENAHLVRDINDLSGRLTSHSAFIERMEKRINIEAERRQGVLESFDALSSEMASLRQEWADGCEVRDKYNAEVDKHNSETDEAWDERVQHVNGRLNRLNEAVDTLGKRIQEGRQECKAGIKDVEGDIVLLEKRINKLRRERTQDNDN